MQNRYVKQVRFEEVELESATFTAPAWDRPATLSSQELDQQRNRKWVTDCCKENLEYTTQVLEHAVLQLARKRQRPTRVPHKLLVKVHSGGDTRSRMEDICDQIISIGSSLEPFASTGGLRASYLYTGAVRKEEEAARVRQFQAEHTEDEVHAMVVINKLTEGFDHNKISVVALLDPMGECGFGNFTQFVGRLLRWIPEEQGADEEDNVGIVVGHQLADLHQFWDKYVAEEAHDIEITRKGKLKQFENVLAQGCTLSPQTVRVFDFQDGAL